MTRKIQAAERSAQQLRDALAQIEGEITLLKAEDERDQQQAAVNEIASKKRTAEANAAQRRAEAATVAAEQDEIAEQMAALQARQTELTTRGGNIAASLAAEEQTIQTAEGDLATENANLQTCNAAVAGLAGNRPPLHRRMVRAVANAVLSKFTK